jgi:hypothetical protein
MDGSSLLEVEGRHLLGGHLALEFVCVSAGGLALALVETALEVEVEGMV